MTDFYKRIRGYPDDPSPTAHEMKRVLIALADFKVTPEFVRLGGNLYGSDNKHLNYVKCLINELRIQITSGDKT